MVLNDSEYNQNVVQILGHTILVPKTWNDMTLKQQIVCNDVLMSLNDATFVQKRIALMQFLTGLSDEFFISWKKMYDDAELWAERFRKLTEFVTDFLFEQKQTADEREQFGIAATLTKCPYPSVILAKKRKGKDPKPIKLWAASDGLENISFAEMAEVFTCFDRYTAGGNEAHIHRAFAVVFRPSKPNDAANKQRAFDGDQRTGLEEADEVIAQRAKLWQDVQPPIKRLLWFWLVSCREQIIRKNPQVFKSGNADALMRRLAVYSWAGVAIELSKGDVLARKAIEVSNYRDIFITLSYLETKSEVTEAIMKKKN
jgi:hypothetical protein